MLYNQTCSKFELKKWDLTAKFVKKDNLPKRRQSYFGL